MRSAQLMGGSLVVATSDRGHVADTGKTRGWISLGDFEGNKNSCNSSNIFVRSKRDMIDYSQIFKDACFAKSI